METEVERFNASQSQDDTADHLFNKLLRFKGKRPLVVATSTLSVDLAKKIARMLGGECEKLLVKKLVDPKRISDVIGAVNEWGGVCLGAEAEARGYNIHNLDQQVMGLVEEMQRYRRQHPAHHSIENQLTIFVDVGSRSGYRLMAALQAVKTFPPKLIIVVTPQITHRAFALVNNLCDDIIALKVV